MTDYDEVMSEIDDIQDGDCWALTQMINRAEMMVDALGKTSGMILAYESACYKGKGESNE